MPLASLAMPAAAIGGWAHLGEPLRAAGFGGFLAIGLALGVMLPGFLVSAGSLPLLLIPNRARTWWRRGREGRPHIPVRLRRAVYAADRYRCCYCGSAGNLQLDHVRPWSKGGLTSLWNMTCLCAYHNQVKSNYWITRDGRLSYRPFPGADNEALAAQILSHELRHRWSPGRWIRAGWSLAA